MPEQHARQVRATYRRYLSDGNYGTEGAELSLEWWVEADDDSHEDLEVADELLANARTLVLAKLRESDNPKVRAAVLPMRPPARPITPPNTAATVPDDGEESLPF